MFVARLQKAAEAFKQLNQRKKGKKKSKKAPAGTGKIGTGWTTGGKTWQTYTKLEDVKFGWGQ